MADPDSQAAQPGHFTSLGLFVFPIIKMRNWTKEFLAVIKIRFLPKTGLLAP